jgi:hypothetical protein
MVQVPIDFTLDRKLSLEKSWRYLSSNNNHNDRWGAWHRTNSPYPHPFKEFCNGIFPYSLV